MATTRKKTTKKKVAGKAIANLTDWEQRLKELASADSARTQASASNVLSIRGGVFSFQGHEIGKEVEVIILDFSHIKQYYDGPFDPETPRAPACFAVGYNQEGLAPHETAPDPQNDNCKDCWANQFGSGTGRGKACKDGRRLAVVHADDNVQTGDIARLITPPTSISKFDGYVRGLSRLNPSRPIFGFVTKMTFDAEEDYPVLKFQGTTPIEEHLGNDPEKLNALVVRRESVQQELVEPVDVSSYEPYSPPAKGRRVSTTTKKKASRSKFS